MLGIGIHLFIKLTSTMVGWQNFLQAEGHTWHLNSMPGAVSKEEAGPSKEIDSIKATIN